MHTGSRYAEEHRPSCRPSTIASILRAEGVPPRGERSTAWNTFLRAHWPALVATDFFTTEMWTGRGLVTYYAVFVIELHSRRVRVGGATRYPDEAFVLQVMRELTDGVDGMIGPRQILICDRNPKWSRAVEAFLKHEGVRIIRRLRTAPNCNAYADGACGLSRRNVWTALSCLASAIFRRRALAEFVTHYDAERNHQGLGNELIEARGRSEVLCVGDGDWAAC